MEPDEGNQVSVRLASLRDAQRIAALCEQLGYPAFQEKVQRRLRRIDQDEDNAAYVAELSSGHVVGWVHVHRRRLIQTDAEVGGLVVDEDRRHGGIGRLLMQQAEQWAREKVCWAVHVRSNVVRKDAHAFYETIGYRRIKTQFTFRKALHPHRNKDIPCNPEPAL